MAAVSLTNPIFIFFMAVENMFGMGGSAVASIALGGQDQKRMRQVSAFITYASPGGRCFLRGCIACFMQPILTLFGVNEGDLCVCKGICVLYFVWSAIYHLVGSSRSFVSVRKVPAGKL